MYCQTCGAECQPGLNYCNRCGGAVHAGQGRQELVPVDIRSPVRVLGVTITLTTLLGLTIMFFGLAGLAAWHLDEGVIAIVGILCVLLLLGINVSLIRLLSRLLGAVPEKKLTLPIAKPSFPTKEFYAPPQYAPTLPEGASSVTEHTTRTFSPVYRDPRT